MLSQFGRTKRSMRFATRQLLKYAHPPMMFPPYSKQTQDELLRIEDPIRYSSLALAIQRLETDQIAGAFAELGVYKGFTSSFIHRQAPNRRFYLFDTFEGFPKQNLENPTDGRFQDTSQAKVAAVVGDSPNIVVRAGFFPESAAGLEDERFALVMLDFDLYQSAMDAFQFFYPRLVPGGYFFMHDYNSMESNRGISRAYSEFMSDKPEQLHEIADVCGSAVFRKQR